MDGAPETSKPAPAPPKPKRRLTVTDKFREAHRESLARAREKARLALRGYKRGGGEDDVAYNARIDRQIKPWCANLRHAVAARRADRSATYASRFTHGLSAPDLDRSAAAAGEDRDELRQHVARCQETIGGLIDDCRLTIDDCQNRGSEFGVRDSADSNPEHRNPNPELTNRQSSIDNRQFDQSSIENRQSTIVLALAYVLWRALRLMRTQVRWERRALAYRLQELAGWRDRNAALTAGRLNQFRSDIDLVTRDVVRAWDRLRQLRKRFEGLWTALFDPERWERLADHIRAPLQFPNEPMFMAPTPSLLDLLHARAGRSRRCGARFHRASGPSAGKACPEQSEGMPAPQDGGDGDSPDLDSEYEDRAEGADRPERPPRVRGPRNPFGAHFDPIAYLCRTRAHGAQDWRLRLDELRAETLGDPFQSPANVEGALEGEAAAAEVPEGRKTRNSRRGVSASDSKRQRRAQNPTTRIPDDGLLEALAAIGMLANLNSLAEVRELLAQGLGDSGLSDSGLSAVAEALWTRIEGMQVLVETLEETLARMLEYHGSHHVGAALVAAQVDGTVHNRAATRAAPTFKAILESKKQQLANSEGRQGSAGLAFQALRAPRTSRGKLAGPKSGPCATRQSDRSEDLRSGVGSRSADLQSEETRRSVGMVGAVREPALRVEARVSGLCLDDLWIQLDPFLPNATPLDGLRQWFEAADGVVNAGSILAQKVDVALYEFAVRQFGIRREFVAWRPPLSTNQRREREGRPEWDVRVTTVEGKVLLKLTDEEVRELSD